MEGWRTGKQKIYKNEFGDEIFSISDGKGVSYRSVIDGMLVFGSLNKVKGEVNRYRGCKTTWKEFWE